MQYDKEFVDEVMYLYDEERQPFSVIASSMKCSIDVIDQIICAEIANNIIEIV